MQPARLVRLEVLGVAGEQVAAQAGLDVDERALGGVGLPRIRSIRRAFWASSCRPRMFRTRAPNVPVIRTITSAKAAASDGTGRARAAAGRKRA